MKKSLLAPETILLAFAAFLLPLIGGHVAAVSVPLTNGIFGEIFGGGALPLTSRFFIALLILGGLTLLLIKRRVIQIPNLRFGYLVLGLVIVLGISILGSSFQFAAFREWQTWVLMVACLFLTVAAVGRDKGWMVVAMSIISGVTILSLRGIYEFASVMRDEPTHRIFAGWSNPNALASVLVAGSLLAIGLTAQAKRLNQILLVTCGAISVVGLVLTQSKGGLLAFAIGFLVLLIQVALTKQYKALGWSMMPFLVGLLLAIGLGQLASSQSQSGQAFSRVANASGSAEQSQGFRKNLWINAAKLGMSNPVGVGVGTYQYSSTKYGLTETTVFAHQSYLQLAAEGGPIALLLFKAAGIWWLVIVLRKSGTQPTDRRLMKAAVIAAVVGMGAHGMIESNLSFLGSGAMLFILLGLGLQTATDGSSPEALPQSMRSTAALFGCVIPLLLMALAVKEEMQKANFLASMPQPAPEVIQLLAASKPADPDLGYYHALYTAESKEDRVNKFKELVSVAPSPRNIRALANAELDAGNAPSALTTVERVFHWDPNNRPGWELKIKILRDLGDIPEAIKTAESFIQIEGQPSYQIRAIPEIIPTETAEARIFLAQQEPDPVIKASHLKGALDIYMNYMRTTYARVLMMGRGGLPFGDQSEAQARENRDTTFRLMDELMEHYSSSGDSVAVTEIAGLREELDGLVSSAEADS